MDLDSSTSFGDLLRRHRLAAGLTQEELAARAQVSARAISDLERGQRHRPWRGTVQLLAEALGLPPSERARLEAAALRASPSAPAPGEPAPEGEPRRSNLPIPFTSFVGRERELAEIRRILGGARLLTLTGTGGCGKTRLALQVGAALLPDYPDGVWLVDLAPLADPDLVASGTAVVLGIQSSADRPIPAQIAAALGSRRLLIIFDNCEHLINACAHLSDAILRACPHVRILATSREPLRIAAEFVWRVPSLAVPGALLEAGAQRQSGAVAESPASWVEALAGTEAVRLFVERAQAVRFGFTLTGENAAAVVEICRRLDGIPLAIELAAARVSGLAPEHIVRHLDDRFRLLTTGSRAALPRHQTLRALIDWSYTLLTDKEQALFRRLGVFVGGWTLEAAETVGGEGLGEMLDLLIGLVDKSIVLVEERSGEARYRLLETLRDYARQKLDESGEARSTAERHARYFQTLVDEAMGLYTSEGPRSRSGWDTRLRPERDNLRAVLAWCREHNPALGLRLGAGLGWFWILQRDLTEGEGWLEGFLAQTVGEPGLRGRALLALATLKRDRGDLAAAQPRFEEALERCRQASDRWGIARSLIMLAFQARSVADYDRAATLARESLAIAREIRVEDSIIWALATLGQIHRLRGDYSQAREWLEEALRRQPGDPFAIEELGMTVEDAGQYDRAEALYREGFAQEKPERVYYGWWLENLGRLARKRGDRAGARRLIEEDLTIGRRYGNNSRICWDLMSLAELDWADNDSTSARARLFEALSVARRWGNRQYLASALLVSAHHAAALGDLGQAARIFGAADAALPGFRSETRHVVPVDYGSALEKVRATLAADAFASAWAEGQAMTVEEAIACVLAVTLS